MNERFEPTRYALDDEALDGLLSGNIDPDAFDMDGNPVASFFAEVRTTAFAGSPRPDAKLSEVFATAPDPHAWSAPSAAPTSATPAMPTTTGAPAMPMGGAPGVPTAATPAASIAGAPAVSDRDLRLESEPTVVNWADPTGYDHAPAPTRARPAPSYAVAPIGAYQPSPMETAANTLRLTPSKLLVAASVLLVAFISFQILRMTGARDDGFQEIAGVEPTAIETVTSDQVATTLPAITTAPSVSAIETVPSSEPAPGAPGQPGPTVAATTPTVNVTASTVLTSPTSVSTTENPPSSDPALTTPSTPVSDPTASSVPTDPTTDGTAPAPDPTSSTIDTVASVSIQAGQVLTAPDDIPTGVYRARVERVSGCTVQVFNASGNQATYQAAGGTDVVFELSDGARVLTAAGCPTTFEVT